jgi:flagellar motor switch protein FliN/FliY
VSTSQADIDSLLAQAESLAAEALDPTQAASGGAAPEAGTPGTAKAGAATATSLPPTPSPRTPPAAPAEPVDNGRRDELGRIMRIEVPVIVKLAECKMPLARIVGLNTGAIIEFDKPADALLDLMISNKCVGLGQAVKVGENFGLRITQIGTLREKIEALGG